MKIEYRLKISIKALSAYNVREEIINDMLKDLDLIIKEKKSEKIAKEHFRKNELKHNVNRLNYEKIDGEIYVILEDVENLIDDVG